MMNKAETWDGAIVRDECGCDFRVEIDEDEAVLHPQLTRRVKASDLEFFERIA